MGCLLGGAPPKPPGGDETEGINDHASGQGKVEDTFDGREGIMSGITHHTPQDAFVDVFGKKKKK